MDMACQLCLSCEVMLVQRIGVSIKDGSVDSKRQENTTEDIVGTSLSRNKPVLVYYNLDQNICNDGLPAIEETKKIKQLSERIQETFLLDMTN